MPKKHKSKSKYSHHNNTAINKTHVHIHLDKKATKKQDNKAHAAWTVEQMATTKKKTCMGPWHSVRLVLVKTHQVKIKRTME